MSFISPGNGSLLRCSPVPFFEASKTSNTWIVWAAMIASVCWAACTGRLVGQSVAFSIPTVNWESRRDGQTIVDREPSTYLGHTSTLLLEDGRTILCVYPKGHGRGPIVLKKSVDGGVTWSDRLKTPKSWETSLETPTIYRTVDSKGKRRIILFSGLFPIRTSISEDDGAHWTDLAPIGDWGGIVAMSSLFPLNTAAGKYMALFHDDGRYIQKGGVAKGVFTVYKTTSSDGGLTWAKPTAIYSSSQVHLCEPGAVRSPDGGEIAVILRENKRMQNVHVMRSKDEGATWSEPYEGSAVINGDRHVARYAKDGRLFISFRDVPTNDAISPTPGSWVAWLGSYDQLVNRGEGQYRICLKVNHYRFDCGYPGVEVLPSGVIVATTYGHWTPKERPYILSVRLKLEDVDKVTVPRALKPARIGR